MACRHVKNTSFAILCINITNWPQKKKKNRTSGRLFCEQKGGFVKSPSKMYSFGKAQAAKSYLQVQACCSQLSLLCPARTRVRAEHVQSAELNLIPKVIKGQRGNIRRRPSATAVLCKKKKKIKRFSYKIAANFLIRTFWTSLVSIK